MDNEAQIVSGGESLSVFEIMQRFRTDGSCEYIVKEALSHLAVCTRSSDASKEYVRGEKVHLATCQWEQTTPEQCNYKETHNYCPHSEHACTCPPEAQRAIEEAGKVGQLMNAADADGYVRGLEDAAKFCDARADEISKQFNGRNTPNERRRLQAKSTNATALAIGIRSLISQHSPEVKK